MNYLEENHGKEINEDITTTISEHKKNKKLKFSYQIVTTTSIIIGILILNTILAVMSSSISHTTILIDILMIIWNFILIIRISIVEKELDTRELNSTDSNKEEPKSNEYDNWI